jgi:hypothetical protein
LILTSFLASSRAQEVSISDPGLNATIRESLQKPVGALKYDDAGAASLPKRFYPLTVP